MKDVRLGKYLISFHIAKGNTLSDNNTVYWIFLWCFLIGVTKLKVNKE